MGLGINSKLYRNTGNFGTPVWDEIPCVADLTVNAAWDKGDGSSRNSPVKMEEPTQLGLTLSGKVIVESSGTDYLALLAAFWARTTLDLMCLDGGSTTNTSEGVRFEGKLSEFSEDQALGNVLFRDFSFSPCVSANPPKSVTVTAGAPVFTSIT